MLSEKLISKIQSGKKPLIMKFEDLVVHSDKLSNEMINTLAEEYCSTIVEFEEILYLLDYLTSETLGKLCTLNKEKIKLNTDLSVLIKKVTPEVLEILYDTQNNLPAES